MYQYWECYQYQYCPYKTQYCPQYLAVIIQIRVGSMSQKEKGTVLSAILGDFYFRVHLCHRYNPTHLFGLQYSLEKLTSVPFRTFLHMYIFTQILYSDVGSSTKNNKYDPPVWDHTLRKKRVPKQYPQGHYLTVRNMAPLGVLFWCPSDPRALFHKHEGKKSAPLKKGYHLQQEFPRGTVLVPFFL